MVSGTQSENNTLTDFIQKLPKNFGISSEDSLSKKLHELVEYKKNSEESHKKKLDELMEDKKKLEESHKKKLDELMEDKKKLEESHKKKLDELMEDKKKLEESHKKKLDELMEDKKNSDVKIQELKKKILNSVKKTELIKYVEQLEPDEDLGAQLRELSKNLKGPWQLSAEAKLVKISVPGKFEQGKNYSCPEHYNKNIEFRSALEIEDEGPIYTPSVRLKITGALSIAKNCRELIRYDFQLNCIDAKKIFSDKVLECNDDNNPLWKIDGVRILPAHATEIP